MQYSLHIQVLFHKWAIILMHAIRLGWSRANLHNDCSYLSKLEQSSEIKQIFCKNPGDFSL